MLTTNNEPGIIVRRAEQLPWLKKEIEHPAVTLEALEELEDMKDKNNPLIFLQNSDRRSTKDTLNKAVLQTGEAELWGDGKIGPPTHHAHEARTDPLIYSEWTWWRIPRNKISKVSDQETCDTKTLREEFQLFWSQQVFVGGGKSSLIKP